MTEENERNVQTFNSIKRVGCTESNFPSLIRFHGGFRRIERISIDFLCKYNKNNLH